MQLYNKLVNFKLALLANQHHNSRCLKPHELVGIRLMASRDSRFPVELRAQRTRYITG